MTPEELAAQLIRSSVEAPKRARDIETQTARKVADTARSLAPRLTGRLADSIDSDGGEVGSDVEYAPYVEYGTAIRPPQPFLGPAVDRHTKDFEDSLLKAIEDSL